ncbi:MULTISPECIES: DUF6124 family protein [Pseudomonas]|uniref:DUF3077 domain-containing protein n=1 Tax=Pseudomonas bijieensis TaxID=2681983 RepID=A0A6N1CFP5_9PSED|nr:MULTISPECIES: DUF6124 family protein [Pseudomonas]PWJ40574.1 hypothetical protein ATJ40_102349 [Pseudomonas sp. 43mfcvi1.1]QKS83262.1 hypothetical protein GN234_15460 [Pseudomonas bijieensis]BBH31033.1 hypothetical protein PBDP_0570 [Pseudomonas sp. St290]SSB95239.1 hypothetical protein SAMN04488697_102349 [Pseudomonas sp. 43mfcvi1.1]
MSESNSGPTKKDSISPEASQIPPMLDEAAKRAIDHYLDPKPQPKKKQPSSQLFSVAESADTETLLANLSETLASANAMLGDLTFDLEGSRRHFALGVQQMIELSELLANRALDIVDPR